METQRGNNGRWGRWCTLLGACLGAVAGWAMQISPPLVLTPATAGGRTPVRLTIINTDAVAMACRMSAVTLAADPTGRTMPGKADEPRSCAGWVTFDKPSFTLAPNEMRAVTASINVPRGSAGGYYALLQCDVTPSKISTPSSGMGMLLSARLASALLLTVQGRGINARISLENIEVSPGTGSGPTSITGGQPWQASIGLVNNGNMHVRVEGEVTIVNSRGSVVDSARLLTSTGLTMPGFPRLFNVVGRRPLANGQYVMNVDVRFAEKRARTTGTITFVVMDGKVTQGEASAEILAAINAVALPFAAEPAFFSVDAPPGGQRVQVVSVRNMSRNPITVEAVPVAWDQNSDGTVTFPAGPPSHGRNGVPLVKVEPAELTLAAGQTARVTVSIAPPRGYEAGEQYVALAFREKGTELPTDDALMRRRTVLGVIVNPRTQEPKTELVDLKSEKRESGAWQFSVGVHNTGNAWLVAKGTMAVLDAKGTRLGDPVPFGTPDEMVLPGVTRVFPLIWPQVLEKGTYQVLFTLEQEDGAPIRQSMQVNVE